MFQAQSDPSQLLSWLHEQKKPHRLRAAIEKERREEFIRQAQEKGFLLSPDIQYLLQKYNLKDVDDIIHLSLPTLNLRTIGDVEQCLNLRYLDLSGNYIAKIDALVKCPFLTKVDLHNNQISSLPSSTFWQSLEELKILYLHNNSIGRVENLQNLGGAPSLYVLTLFDTPISLKRSYRHHVVNSIWSLKALDYHVVSDEEIIEDAKFGGHFSTMNSSFQFDPFVDSTQEKSLAEEMKCVNKILSSVSQIQAKHSPVLIIQRYIRGHLGRKYAKTYAAIKVWAVVVIQRYWRTYKGIKYKIKPTRKKSKAKIIPKKPENVTRKDSEASKGEPTNVVKPELTDKPSSEPQQMLEQSRQPAAQQEMGQSKRQQSQQMVVQTGQPQPQQMVVQSRQPQSQQKMVQSQQQRLDYDTYLQNRRPGSVTPSVMDDRSGDSSAGYLPHIDQTPTSPRSTPSSRQKANLLIDLNKLEAASQLVPILSSRSAVTQMEIAPNPSFVIDSSVRSSGERFEKERKKSRRKRVSVTEMLGKLNDSYLQRERQESSGSEDDEPKVKFRVSGIKSLLHNEDLVRKLYLEKREAGEDIRSSHKNVIDKTRPKPIKLKKAKKANSNQRLFARIHGTMGIACLRAVQQAYKDREKAEMLASKVDYVMSLRDQRDQARERRTAFLEEKRNNIIRKHDRDTLHVAEAIAQHKSLKADDLEKRLEKRLKASGHSADFFQNKIFTANFNEQHTSISKALLKHDRQTKVEERLKCNQQVVRTEREQQRKQAELIQRYLEHRRLMRQAQVAVEKAAIDTKLLQDASENLVDAKNRVERQKRNINLVKPFYPLPKTSTNPIRPAVPEEGKPDRWHTLIMMYEGRVGNHPAVAGK